MTVGSSSIFFTFDSIEREIRKKISSLSIGDAELRTLFADSIRSVLSSVDLRRSLDLYDLLGRLPFGNVYPGYFSHPVRVTAAFAHSITRPLTFDDVSLGLCHNMKENIVEGGDRILAGQVSEATRRQIDLLTIDRTQQFEESYLERYYSAIAEDSADLILFKAHDKLDNLLISVCAPESVEHRAVTRNHVVSRLRRLYPQCADYIEALLSYVEQEENRKRYEAECRCVKGLV